MMGLRIALLKAKVRSAYRQYHAELDSMSCGKAIGETINSRMYRAKVEFNETMDKLAKLDPGCPKQRL